ncbi:F0F1 ATP synthase subunit A [Qiania dongpingensis]|uniref:ATP synthase subunit a n=2 Tax=Qiania dongpingensis TaxID=2763669 RepID=A0A7G9G897_9FIRM|nr:F0F1 ATP synthase subunit A [Qiania dongpingensis]QNM07029.1 F0F1 ATP synthase subunit A [Qiania dongpingensis]
MILCEADFAIHGLVSYELFGHTFWLTTTHVSMIIVTVVILIFAFAANRCMKKAKEVPTGFQNAVEMIVEMLGKMVSTNMKKPKKFLNYIGTLFLFILICNLSGLLGLRGPTADYGVTLCLGLITFVLIQYNGIKCQRAGHFKALFEPIPLFFPINLIGEIATPISLSLRLFANMLAGTIIMALWYGIIPIVIAKLGIPAFLHAYLDLFSGCIQTYVFCMLTMVYVDDKM